ncbi:MAG: M42 family metallopeptidase [Candidatus Neomarinimicrobiota bacterium]
MSIDSIKKLVGIPSPSGFTDKIIDMIENELKSLNYFITRTYKGSLIVSTDPNPTLMIMGHIDTLGGMVSKITTTGTLRLSQLGGYPANSFEGEYLTVYTMNDKNYRGTFLLDNPAVHVNKDIKTIERNMGNMHIRLDALVTCKKDVEELGISIGDFVVFDPRFELTESGFIKSRFMDDKACAGVMLDILLKESKLLKDKKVAFYFSNYEEVGHACPAGLPGSLKDLLIADMGVVGDGVAGDETKVSICAKDSAGPYDLKFRQKLEKLSSDQDIAYTVDVFPFYSSDGTAVLRSGKDVRVGLIGPGVSASHGVERTHKNGIKATRQLIMALIATY